MRLCNDDPIDALVAKRVRLLRKRRGLYQQNLAWKIGVEPRQLRRYETAEHRISASRLWRIKEALNCELEDFFIGAEFLQEKGNKNT